MPGCLLGDFSDTFLDFGHQCFFGLQDLFIYLGRLFFCLFQKAPCSNNVIL